MKKAILFFVAHYVLCSFFAQTQQLTIKGKITDDSGKSLPWASVFLENTSAGSVSDENGIFTLEVPEKGTYFLAAKFLGFKNFRTSITVTSSISDFDITLSEEDILLEEAVVEATRAGESTPFAYSNINGDELRTICIYSPTFLQINILLS